MLLNTVLTVRAHQPILIAESLGEFTDAAIRALNEQDRPMVFILWGRPAQTKKAMLTNPKHLILEAPHPAAVSLQGIFRQHGPSGPDTNEYLKEHGIEPIDWQIENI